MAYLPFRSASMATLIVAVLTLVNLSSLKKKQGFVCDSHMQQTAVFLIFVL